MSNHYTKIISKAVLIAAWCLWFRVLFAPRPTSCRVHGCPACSGGGKCRTCDVPRARKRVCQQFLLNSRARSPLNEWMFSNVFCLFWWPTSCYLLSGHGCTDWTQFMLKSPQAGQKFPKIGGGFMECFQKTRVVNRWRDGFFSRQFQLIFVWIFSHES